MVRFRKVALVTLFSSHGLSAAVPTYAQIQHHSAVPHTVAVQGHRAAPPLNLGHDLLDGKASVDWDAERAKGGINSIPPAPESPAWHARPVPLSPETKEHEEYAEPVEPIPVEKKMAVPDDNPAFAFPEWRGGYVPKYVTCPASDHLFARPARGIVSSEREYATRRSEKASAAVLKWASRFFPTTGMSAPGLGLAVSGGGYKSMFTGAGILKAFDAREDSSLPTAGLRQALTYVTGVNGGAWLLSSLAAHDNAKVSEVLEEHWAKHWGLTAELSDDSHQASQEQLFYRVVDSIMKDVYAKKNNGQMVSIVDAWGRVLAYQLFPGHKGGVDLTLSGLRGTDSYQAGEAPILIMGAMAVDSHSAGKCYPDRKAAYVEMTPFEFGSFDTIPAAFAPMELLGSRPSYAVLSPEIECVAGMDNLGFMVGLTSNRHNALCRDDEPDMGLSPIFRSLLAPQMMDPLQGGSFGLVPNPFYKYVSPATPDELFYKAQPFYSTSPLYLVDGGESNHEVGLQPLLEPARNLSVVFVSDVFPNGEQLLAAHFRANDPQNENNNGRLEGRFPTLPDREAFAAHKGAWFFGCDDPAAATIIYLPSAVSTGGKREVDGSLPVEKRGVAATMIMGMGLEAGLGAGMNSGALEALVNKGVNVATNGGESDFGLCLACAVMKKHANGLLPASCGPCFDKYCYHAPARPEQEQEDGLEA